MGSPPPPPIHHGYGYPGPRDVRSPFSDNSGRYSDNYGQHSDIHYDQRPASRAPSSRTTSSTGSNSNKAYVYYQLTRGDNGWAGCRRYEISATQEEIKKKLKKGSKSGNAAEQLKKMGRPRQDEIERLRVALDASETDGSTWDVAFIENTKTKAKDSLLKVIEFSIIFQKRSPKPEASRRQSKAAEMPFFQQVPAQTPYFAPQPTPIVTDANKGAKVSTKDEYLTSPFAKNVLFSPLGQPMNASGPIPFMNSMPGNTADRPMAQMMPKAQHPFSAAAAAKKPQAKALPRGHDPLDLDALLDQGHGGGPDVINVGEEDTHHGRPSLGHRRQSSAQRSTNSGRYRHVNIETRHPESYTSNRSSWATDDGSVIVGEVDELSSRTSDDTNSSRGGPARKTYRSYGHARHSSSHHSPGSPRHHGGDLLTVVPERTRRPTDPHKPLFGAVEQFSPKQNTSKPMVVQKRPPQSSGVKPTQEIPPEAVYPSHFNERDQEHNVNDYMRRSQREEEENKARTARAAERERELERERREFEDKRNAPTRPVEVTSGGRNRRYTYEPRDIYGS